jgi:hypothetical protein
LSEFAPDQALPKFPEFPEFDVRSCAVPYGLPQFPEFAEFVTSAQWYPAVVASGSTETMMTVMMVVMVMVMVVMVVAVAKRTPEFCTALQRRVL